MYVTLASNASKKVYGDQNTGSSFKNLLSQPLEFMDREWEVGVKKIIYHSSFKTIVNEAFRINIQYPQHLPSIIRTNVGNPDNPHEIYSKQFTHFKHLVYKKGEGFEIGILENTLQRYFVISVDISPDKFKIGSKYELSMNDSLKSKLLDPNASNFSIVVTDKRVTKEIAKAKSGIAITTDDFIVESFHVAIKPTESGTYDLIPGNFANVDGILSQMNKKSDIIKFSYEHERVSVNFANSNQSIYLLNGLKYILGFENDYLSVNETAKYPPQLNRGLFAIFIYSNICTYSHVGDTVVPLLNVISMPASTYGQIVSIDVNDPMYIPVSYKSVSEIQIKLTADTGEELPFDTADTKTIIVLHFRERV